MAAAVAAVDAGAPPPPYFAADVGDATPRAHI
jgi:hypothetical protein